MAQMAAPLYGGQANKPSNLYFSRMALEDDDAAGQGGLGSKQAPNSLVNYMMFTSTLAQHDTPSLSSQDSSTLVGSKICFDSSKPAKGKSRAKKRYTSGKQNPFDYRVEVKPITSQTPSPRAVTLLNESDASVSTLNDSSFGDDFSSISSRSKGMSVEDERDHYQFTDDEASDEMDSGSHSFSSSQSSEDNSTISGHSSGRGRKIVKQLIQRFSQRRAEEKQRQNVQSNYFQAKLQSPPDSFSAESSDFASLSDSLGDGDSGSYLALNTTLETASNNGASSLYSGQWNAAQTYINHQALNKSSSSNSEDSDSIFVSEDINPYKRRASNADSVVSSAPLLTFSSLYSSMAAPKEQGTFHSDGTSDSDVTSSSDGLSWEDYSDNSGNQQAVKLVGPTSNRQFYHNPDHRQYDLKAKSQGQAPRGSRRRRNRRVRIARDATITVGREKHQGCTAIEKGALDLHQHDSHGSLGDTFQNTFFTPPRAASNISPHESEAEHAHTIFQDDALFGHAGSNGEKWALPAEEVNEIVFGDEESSVYELHVFASTPGSADFDKMPMEHVVTDEYGSLGDSSKSCTDTINSKFQGPVTNMLSLTCGTAAWSDTLLQNVTPPSTCPLESRKSALELASELGIGMPGTEILSIVDVAVQDSLRRKDDEPKQICMPFVVLTKDIEIPNYSKYVAKHVGRFTRFLRSH